MKILARQILALMGSLGMMNLYFCRINISIAMVAMVGVSDNNDNDTLEVHCKDRGSASDESPVTSDGQFDWSPGKQGLLTGSYYYGYTAGQIPVAWLSSKLGFRKVFGFSMLISSFLTLLFPVAAKASFYLAVTARIVLGVFHSVAFPAMAGAWGAWAPPLERTKLNGFVQSGASIGTFLIFTLAGYIADNLGWESVFYVTGSLTLVWVVFWFYLAYDTPRLHPRIDKEEMEYIETSLGDGDIDRKKLAIPWVGLLTSLPVWGIVLGHTASNWGNYTLNQQLATYLTNVLRYSLSFTGLLASLCYLFQWAVCVGASWLTDLIRTKGIMSTINIRKLNTWIGLWLTAACTAIAGYAGCGGELTVALFVLSAGLNFFTVPGCKSGSLDIAPAYSGMVFGLSNTVANIPGFVAPQLVGVLLTDLSSIIQWRTVFWVSAGVHLAGSLLYLLKGSADEQKWAVPVQQKSAEGLEKQDTKIRV